MKTTNLIIVCLTIYLCIFTHGCWNTVNNTLNHLDCSIPKLEQTVIEKPIIKEDLPQLFIIPTPQLQEQEIPVEEENPKTFAHN